jgi:tripartite-type tricarboxylate transporter receptor subunit TctC
MHDIRLGRALRAMLAGLLLSVAGAAAVAAETGYPSRPLRVVLGSTAGSGSDVVARTLSTRLAENIGQPVVVDNRAGAAGVIGAEIVAKAAPDGYTIFIATLTQHLSTTLQNKYLLAKEFEPIGFLANTPFMLVASASVPARTTEEFIAYAKARPGKLLFGSSGRGGSLHICLELFQSMAGLKMVHVPYKGTPAALTDLMSGTIQLLCPPVASMASFLNNAKLQVLGVTTREPTALAPGYPAIAQALPGYVFPGWYGAFAPLKTPKPIIARLHQELARTVNAPDMRDRLIKVGVEPAMSTPEEFRDFLRRESKRMEGLLRDAGVGKAQ